MENKHVYVFINVCVLCNISCMYIYIYIRLEQSSLKVSLVALRVRFVARAKQVKRRICSRGINNVLNFVTYVIIQLARHA